MGEHKHYLLVLFMNVLYLVSILNKFLVIVQILAVVLVMQLTVMDVAVHTTIRLYHVQLLTHTLNQVQAHLLLHVH